MNVTHLGTDRKYRLIWIELDDGEYTINARLNESGQLIPDDCEYDWGAVGEYNEEAFEAFGERKCMELLFKHAAKFIPDDYKLS